MWSTVIKSETWIELKWKVSDIDEKWVIKAYLGDKIAEIL